MRTRAQLVIALFVASVAYGIFLLLALEPEVQGLDSAELFAREDDARTFLIQTFSSP